MQEKVVELFSKELQMCARIGAWTLLATFILGWGLYVLNRGRYLKVKMGAFVDLVLIKHTIEECFARQFLKKISLFDVQIGAKSQLEIKVSLVSLEQELFVQVEKTLQSLLKEHFGYIKPFYLVVKI